MTTTEVTRNILARLTAEFAAGQHQATIDALPCEIQFRLDCPMGRALSEANTIRVKAGRVQS